MGIKVEMTEGKETTPEVVQKPAEVVAEVKQTEEPKYVKLEDLDKINQALNNTREYNNRKLAEINEKLEKLIPKAVEPKGDELDELVQKDWKAGVKEVTRQVLEEDRKRQTVQTEEQKVALILEQSKAKVMAKHPELSDPNSEKSQEFLKVLEENQDFRTNPRGPLLAAYEMEQRIKSHGNVEPEPKEARVVAQERVARGKGAGIPAGTSPARGNGTITLTRAQMDFCRHNGINPENYKKNLGLMEARG